MGYFLIQISPRHDWQPVAKVRVIGRWGTLHYDLLTLPVSFASTKSWRSNDNVTLKLSVSFPPYIFSPRHFQTGLRVYFGKNTIPSFLQNWNPWSHEVPFVTFCWHKGNDVVSDLPPHMQLDPFQESLIQAITDSHNTLQEGVAQDSLEIEHNEPIMIQVYCGISSIFHNYGIFGFNRDRGKFGF